MDDVLTKEDRGNAREVLLRGVALQRNQLDGAGRIVREKNAIAAPQTLLAWLNEIDRLSAEVTALRANQKLSAEDYAALRAWSENPKPPATMTAGVVRDAADAVWPVIGALKAQLAGMEGSLRVAMEDEAKLRAVVENLPLSADGVRVVPGMTLWRPEREDGRMALWVNSYSATVGPENVWAASFCYSTEAGAAAQRDAARAAHDAKAGKGAQS